MFFMSANLLITIILLHPNLDFSPHNVYIYKMTAYISHDCLTYMAKFLEMDSSRLSSATL